MKYQFFHTMMNSWVVLTAILMIFASRGCLGVFTYTYSVSSDFPNGINAPQLESEIEKAYIWNATLVGITVVADVVNITFEYPLMEAQDDMFAGLIRVHTTTSLLDRVCTVLPDASTTLTKEMIQLSLLVATCTVARNYTFLNATEMVNNAMSNRKFDFINDGIAPATIVMGTGGTTTYNMVIGAKSAGQFLYIITNDITGSHAYTIFRTSAT